MSNIVERLRGAIKTTGCPGHRGMFADAADEIERLRAALEGMESEKPVKDRETRYYIAPDPYVPGWEIIDRETNTILAWTLTRERAEIVLAALADRSPITTEAHDG